MDDWLHVREGAAPLVIGLPHTGVEIPQEIQNRLTSVWLARKDADWWVDLLYDFAAELDATVVRTTISRSVIDVNRDPSGQSLYPGMATTGLCPLETFDGEPLYLSGQAPTDQEIVERRARWFAPYHKALAGQLERLRRSGPVVLYDAHSIRSIVPRLFEGLLPQFNIGDFDGTACSPRLTEAVRQACALSGDDWVVNGRFKGGWTTRRYGVPQDGIHAIQMELADRGYIIEPEGGLDPDNWPPPYDPAFAEPMRQRLRQVLRACVDFARSQDEHA